MRVCMLGWEFPPFKAGGLGVHCYELTRELSRLGVNVDFYMPFVGREMSAECEYVHIHPVKARPELGPYELLSQDFYAAVREYNRNVVAEAMNCEFDIVHCHDWLTYMAGVELKRLTGKPLVVTVHSTEMDRTAGNPSRWIFEIERRGMLTADLVITVSNRTKGNLSSTYNIDPAKIVVVYNGVNPNVAPTKREKGLWGKRVVLYLGRLTIQKNPEIFLRAAKKMLERDKNVHFIIAGTGDMMGYLINKSIELGISKDVTFTGFISDEEASWLYSVSDVYVLPAVSEPFGITVLEAMVSGAAVVISKDVGVGEVLNHCLKVDFWDADDIAQKVGTLIEFPRLRDMVARGASEEAKRFTWDKTARETLSVYDRAMGMPEGSHGGGGAGVAAGTAASEEPPELDEVYGVIRRVRGRRWRKATPAKAEEEPPFAPEEPSAPDEEPPAEVEEVATAKAGKKPARKKTTKKATKKSSGEKKTTRKGAKKTKGEGAAKTKKATEDKAKKRGTKKSSTKKAKSPAKKRVG